MLNMASMLTCGAILQDCPAHFIGHFGRSREIPPCKRIRLWDFSARFRSVEMTEVVNTRSVEMTGYCHSERSEESDCPIRLSF